MDNRPSIELTLEEMAVILAVLDELLSGREPDQEVLEMVRTTSTMLRERSRASTT